jgi:hypothetical protein
LNSPAVNRPNQSSPNQPDIDSLRAKSFSGLESFLEPERPKTGGRRILLLVLLLAALGASGWWTYTYLEGTESQKSKAASVTEPDSGTDARTKSAGDTANDTPKDVPNNRPPTKAAAPDASPSPQADSSQVPASPAPAPEHPSEKASAGSDAPQPNAKAEAKLATKASPAIPRVALDDRSAEKRAEKREPRINSAKSSKLPEPAAADSGVAEFHKGEAYLYGRGAAENCDQAVKYLKAASAKSNAKARSAFGTMYATGHCVARDLPTSYLWFAMALRVDPNNQILEKDLSAVWNQMTPPERQLATRMKQ